MSITLPALLLLACVTVNGANQQPQDWQSSMSNGNALRHSGKYAEAEAFYREAVKFSEPPQSEPLHLSSALNSLGMTYEDLNRTSEAEQCYRRALTTIEEALGLRSIARAQIFVNLSGVYLHKGQYAKAADLLNQALSIYDGLVPPGSMLIALARTCLGEALLHQGLIEEAASVTEKAREVLQAEQDPREGYYGMCLNNLGAIRRSQGREEESIELFKQSLTILEQDRGIDNPIIIFPLNNLGTSYQRINRTKDAEFTLARALAIAEASLGTAHPVYGTVLLNYSQCLKKMGRKAESRRFETKASAIMKADRRITGADFTVDITSLRAK